MIAMYAVAKSIHKRYILEQKKTHTRFTPRYTFVPFGVSVEELE